MAADPVELGIQEEDVQQAEDGKRDRSTIKFPYGDLADAVDIATGVHGEFGTSCQWDQLAAKLKLAADGGGFRQKMLTAKLFGVVDYSQRKVTLTQLGSRLCDPIQEKGARVDAFLTVPLYKAVYEKFKGNTLPPPNALESEMVGMGVAEKQADKARQYFQRSAEQAGFFWSGSDRLVVPANKPNGTSTPPANEQRIDQEDPSLKGKGGGGGGGGDDLHALISGLLQKLPKPDAEWPLEDRRKWLRTAAQNFDLVFKGGDDTRSIKVSIEKEGG